MFTLVVARISGVVDSNVVDSETKTEKKLAYLPFVAEYIYDSCLGSSILEIVP